MGLGLANPHPDLNPNLNPNPNPNQVNRTRGGLDNVPCVPKLKDKVNIGVYPQAG